MDDLFDSVIFVATLVASFGAAWMLQRAALGLVLKAITHK
jgi:hypothetical protein